MRGYPILIIHNWYIGYNFKKKNLCRFQILEQEKTKGKKLQVKHGRTATCTCLLFLLKLLEIDNKGVKKVLIYENREEKKETKVEQSF